MSSSRTSNENIKLDYQEIADQHFNKASSYLREGNYSSAIARLKRAIKKIENHYKQPSNIVAATANIETNKITDGDRRRLARYQCNLGHAYHKKHEFELAIKSYYRALRQLSNLTEKNNDDDNRCVALYRRNLEVVFSNQKKYMNAIHEGELAIQAYGKIKVKTDDDHYSLAACLNNLASDYCHDKKRDRAIKKFELAIAELNEIKNKEPQHHRELTMYHENLLMIYMKNNSDKAVIKSLRNVIDELKIISDDYIKQNDDRINEIKQLKKQNDIYLNEIKQLKKQLHNPEDQDKQKPNKLVKQKHKSNLLANSMLAQTSLVLPKKLHLKITKKHP